LIGETLTAVLTFRQSKIKVTAAVALLSRLPLSLNIGPKKTERPNLFHHKYSWIVRLIKNYQTMDAKAG